MSGIVDAHVHIWRQADLPWLTGPMQPRIFGPYEPIRRDYRIEDYRADTAGCDVVRGVYVQANWASARALDEVAFVSGEAERAGFDLAITAFADMSADDVRAQLEALARYPRVRGVRQQLHWHSNPDYRFATRPDLGADPRVQANVRALAAFGFVFELQVFAGQVESALALVRACPQVSFVLVHALMLEDLAVEGRAAWRAALARLAAEPNVVAKLSGLNTFVRRLDPRLVAGICTTALELFGPQRCLFGSNFPIERLWTDYASLLAAYAGALEGLEPADRQAVLSETATRIYRLRTGEAV